MIKLSVLFSVKTYPTASDDYYDDNNPNIAGLAEWFLTIPDLFLLLLGKDAQATPFAAYGEAGTNKALVCETQKAQQRWQAFYTIAKLAAPQFTAQLAHIDSLLMAEKQAYLLLDIWWSVTEKSQAKKAYNAHVSSLISQAALLDEALLVSTPNHVAAPIAEILANSQQFGYWSTAVMARTSEIEREDIANIPFLANFEENDAYWLDDIPAYIVRKKGNTERSPIGVVTPYGRWLVPVELGMTSLDLFPQQQNIRDGWIKCEVIDYDNKNYETIKHNSVLFDINGNQATPVLQNTGLDVHSAKVGSLHKNVLSNTVQNDIVNLPDLSVILADTQHAYSEDGYLHLHKSHAVLINNQQLVRGSAGLMSLEGRVIVPTGIYESIGPVHKTKQIAAVTKLNATWVSDADRRPDSSDDISHFVGLIDAKGNELIPCVYCYLLPRNGDGQIKVHQKDRLLFMGVDKKLSIFRDNGELVAATQYEVPGQLIHLGGYLQDGLITVTDGENVMQMDFDGVARSPEIALEAFMDEILRPCREILERFEKNRENPTTYKTVSAQDIIDADPWNTLFTLCNCLSLGDEPAALKMNTAMAEFLASDEYDEEDWAIPAEQPALSVVFNLVFRDAADSGFGARIDWKDSETLGALASMAPNIAALTGFKWDANDNGDSMTDGITAAAKHVRKSKVNLFTLPADGDLYEIGFVRDADMQTMMELTSGVGINLNFEW